MLIMTAIVVVSTAMVLIITTRHDKRMRERFSAAFDEAAPKKGACPEEMKILRTICRNGVRRCLDGAADNRKTRQKSSDLGVVRAYANYEQENMRAADQAFRLSKYFGLVPKDVRTPEDFVRKTDSEATSDTK